MTQSIFYVHSTYAGPGLAYAMSNATPSESAEKLLAVDDVEHANLNEDDIVESLFEGACPNPCQFCLNELCECQTTIRTRIDVTEVATTPKYQKKRRAMERLKVIFKEGDQPLCRFN